jgi:hypothetical protein
MHRGAMFRSKRSVCGECGSVIHRLRFVANDARELAQLRRPERRIQGFPLCTMLLALGDEDTRSESGRNIADDELRLVVHVCALQDVLQRAQVGGHQPRPLNTLVSTSARVVGKAHIKERTVCKHGTVCAHPALMRDRSCAVEDLTHVPEEWMRAFGARQRAEPRRREECGMCTVERVEHDRTETEAECQRTRHSVIERS